MPTEPDGMRVAAIAASGSTVTTRPAVAGDMPQPETSRSTRRKSAATRPPERKSSAAFALRCGRPADARGRSSAVALRVASVTSGTRASGTCTRKIDLQPSSSVKMPPAPGPNAAPRMPAATQMRAACALLPVVSASRSSAATTTNAAPTAWTQRAATSSSNDPASPQASDAAAKTTAPATKA